MSLNETPSADRLHIAFFGKRNAGKSSLMNAVTNQPMAIVSDTPGTTTDPVSKAMELLPLGPVLMIDTAGLDDTGELGSQRVHKSMQVMRKTDLAILVTNGAEPLDVIELALLEQLNSRSIPYVLVRNKCDLTDRRDGEGVFVSACTGEGIDALKQAMIQAVPREESPRLVGDLLTPGDLVVLVIPIDEAAPKGRIILPQQQVLRDVLDAHASAVVCQAEDLPRTLSTLNTPPRIVITDSQAFGQVSRDTPESVPLTSFSILMARAKGNLSAIAAGAMAADHLQDGDRILVSEGCTHHRQCNDIGTVKLPGWIEKYTGKKLSYEFTSGGEFPAELEKYALIVHCGGCMLNEREMKSRIARARAAGVPFTNYGIAIAQMHGILQRALSPFPKFAKAFQKNRTGDDDRV